MALDASESGADGIPQDDGLGYSRHYAQRIRELGKTSKESWIKRLWNHMFGAANKTESWQEDQKKDSLPNRTDGHSDSSDKHSAKKEREDVKLPPIHSGKDKEVRFKEGSNRHASEREESLHPSRENSHSAPPQGASSARPFSGRVNNGLPAQLVNSPYLPPKDKIVYYRMPKPREASREPVATMRNSNGQKEKLQTKSSTSLSLTHLKADSLLPLLPHRPPHPPQTVRPRVPTRDAAVIQLEKRAKVSSDRAIKVCLGTYEICIKLGNLYQARRPVSS